MNSRLYLIIIIFIFIFSCTAPLVEITVVDQKTALENQVLGSYKELSKDVMLLASVRSVDESGKLIAVPEIPKGKKNVIAAMQRRNFNKDDIESFKLSATCGETNNGLLAFFETDKTKNDSKYKNFVNSILKEENEDRLGIMQRIVDTNENFTDGDLPKVQKIFANLNRDNAKTGELIQKDDGKWIEKSKN